MHLYLNTHDKVKQFVRSTIYEENSVGTNDDLQKRPIGYVSIISLSSTIPTDTVPRPKFSLASKSHHRTVDYGKIKTFKSMINLFCFFLEKSFNEDDEYVEEEDVNSELEDSDPESSNKNKQQKFNPNHIRNKIIKIFKRKNRTSTGGIRNPTTTIHPTNLSDQHPTFLTDRHSDLEEDPPSDISDSTIPVDQWSIESVPKPGFTPFEHLQTLKFVSQRK